MYDFFGKLNHPIGFAHRTTDRMILSHVIGELSLQQINHTVADG